MFQAFIPLPAESYPTAAHAARFFPPLLTRVKALPGVVDASISTSMPPSGGSVSRIEVAGKASHDDAQALLQYVSEAHFRVLRIAFAQGRPFSEPDVDDARNVNVVNQTFVRKYLPGDDPVGQRVRLARLVNKVDPTQDGWFQIVGVAADVVNRGLRAPIEPEVWIPYTIAAPRFAALLVRTAQLPGTIANAVQREV